MKTYTTTRFQIKDSLTTRLLKWTGKGIFCGAGEPATILKKWALTKPPKTFCSAIRGFMKKQEVTGCTLTVCQRWEKINGTTREMNAFIRTILFLMPEMPIFLELSARRQERLSGDWDRILTKAKQPENWAGLSGSTICT